MLIRLVVGVGWLLYFKCKLQDVFTCFAHFMATHEFVFEVFEKLQHMRFCRECFSVIHIFFWLVVGGWLVVSLVAYTPKAPQRVRLRG